MLFGGVYLSNPMCLKGPEHNLTFTKISKCETTTLKLKKKKIVKLKC